MQKSSFSITRLFSTDITAVEANSAITFARHTHDEYGIGVILEGAQRSWSGRGTVEAGKGDFITVNPGEVHDGTPIGESRRWAMLYISSDKMASIVSDIRQGNGADMEFANPVIRDPHGAKRFAEAYAALTGKTRQSMSG